MRFTSLEAVGLRCIVQLARSESTAPRGIADIADAEFLSPEYTAKMMRLLRNAGLTKSTRGVHGGYTLTRPANEITAWHVIEALDDSPQEKAGCSTDTNCTRCHGGNHILHCPKSDECSVRSLWKATRTAVQEVLGRITIEQLTGPEVDVDEFLSFAQIEPKAGILL
jgi:Rrf2 family protein